MWILCDILGWYVIWLVFRYSFIVYVKFILLLEKLMIVKRWTIMGIIYVR